eukprot:m.243514 g.243514  ORF g.243514 m.243514 type:complete len:163 (-) comp15344_c0_seq17:370-858(-)
MLSLGKAIKTNPNIEEILLDECSFDQAGWWYLEGLDFAHDVTLFSDPDDAGEYDSDSEAEVDDLTYLRRFEDQRDETLWKLLREGVDATALGPKLIRECADSTGSYLMCILAGFDPHIIPQRGASTHGHLGNYVVPHALKAVSFATLCLSHTHFLFEKNQFN